MRESTPLIAACWDKYRLSPLIDPKHSRRRDMAYLLSYKQKDRLMIEDAGDHHGGLVAYNTYGQTLFGWPVYIGPWNPDPWPLFLPEPTVRSMVGMTGADLWRVERG